MPDADLPSAARRVADSLRTPNTFCDVADLRALLPVLDAVVAGQDDEARVERWARAMCVADGIDPDQMLSGYGAGPTVPMWHGTREDAARAAIALADAERVAQT